MTDIEKKQKLEEDRVRSSEESTKLDAASHRGREHDRDPKAETEEPSGLELEGGALTGEAAKQWKPTRQFWLIVLALCLATFLSALDFTSVSTALPTIAEDIGGDDYVWVGSAYALTSTAWLPWSGGLSHVFGRRPIMIASLLFFGVGSVICGAATSMNMLIAGRAVQGVGGGGILSLTEQIACDIVPLAQRGKYMGLLGAVWAVSAAIGPLLGGVFADSNWRWLFYMNLPILGLAFPAVFFFLKLRTPAGTIREKLKKIDFSANVLFVASATSAMIALAWAGVKYPWDSWRILVPLILGLVGMVVYVFLERFVVTEPTMPVKELANRTSLIGYVNTFLHGLATLFVTYYGPVYFQAVKGHSATRSGVDFFPLSLTTGPLAVVGGIAVAVTKSYKTLNIGAWFFMALGTGLLALYKVDTSTGVYVVILIVLSIGIAPLFPLTVFPVVAPLEPRLHARAMASHAFSRAFGQVWGITVGATILQNELKGRLPDAFVARFPQGAEIAYASIPVIRTLDEPLKGEVEKAFVDSLRILWYTGLGICIFAGILACFFGVFKLHEETDGEWGIEEKKPVEEEKK
ncbi:iron permease [Atractiella rhizophila]|nr:iron permease [Atractiella rhizophila]